MTEVFIDVLAVENFIMDFFILYMTSRLLYIGRSARPRRLEVRLAVSSAIGVCYTVCSILFFRSALSLLIFKIALSVLMVYVAFRPGTLRSFFKSIGCFYGVTLLSGGAALCILTMTGSGTDALTPTSVPYILPAAALVAVVGDVVLRAVRDHQKLSRSGADLYVQFTETGLWLPALIDSGNELKDPYNGNPVIIAELSAVQGILPPGIPDFLKEHGADEILEAPGRILPESWLSRIRLIPFSSLGCENGLLIGFRADLIRIRTCTGAYREARNQTVCVCRRTLSAERKYRALLGSALLAS